MKRFTVFGTMALLAAAATAWAEQISYPFENANCSMTIVDGKAVFTGQEFLTEADGKPALPGFTRTFILPPNADMNSLKVTMENPVEAAMAGSFTVPLSRPYETAMGAVKSSRSYSFSADTYPESFARLNTTGTLGNCKLITVEINPFLRHNVDKTYTELKSGVVKIDYSTTSESAPSNILPWFVDDLQRIVENYSEAIGSYTIDQGVSTPHMAIITTQATVDGSGSLADFIAMKERNGFKITLVTEAEWSGSGWDKADDIRLWLQTNYESERINYALLIGDPTPTTGDLPMKVTLPMATPIGNDCPTDYYFADLTGDWDLNKNAWFGEGGLDVGIGGADKYSEVAVGRIPLYDKDYASLDRILDKTIKYADADPATIGWRKNILMAAEPSDPFTPSYSYAEAVKEEFAAPLGWGTFRLYKESYGDVVPDLSPTIIENMTATWKASPYGLCEWQTHGNEDLAKMIMNSETAAQLSDEYPTLVYQGSCLNAHPETKNNLAYSLLKTGAVGTIASTRLSLYKSGLNNPKDIKLTNLAMCYYFAKYMIRDGETIGDALCRLKSEVDGDFTGAWLNYCDYVVYGDPSISINSCSGQSVAVGSPEKPGEMKLSYSDGALELTVAGALRSAEIRLYNLRGQLVFTKKISGVKSSVRLNNFYSGVAKGVYMLSVKGVNSSGNELSQSAKVSLF